MTEQVQSLRNGNLIIIQSTALLTFSLKHLSLSNLNSQPYLTNKHFRRWEGG
jgi:hypothetical protein